MKSLIIALTIFMLMSTMTFATIQRSQSGGINTVTYTSNSLTAASYGKAYWSVDENVASCNVNGATCSATNVDCNYVGGVIRVVAYTPEGGGAITKTVQVTITGTGTCQLTNGQGIESYDATPGSATSLSGSVTLDIGISCTPMNDVLTSIGQWKAQSLTMDNLLSKIAAWKLNPC